MTTHPGLSCRELKANIAWVDIENVTELRQAAQMGNIIHFREIPFRSKTTWLVSSDNNFIQVMLRGMANKKQRC